MVRMTPIHMPEKTPRGRELTGVSLVGQLPVLEHARNGHAPRVWKLWTSYDDTLTQGVYLELLGDGAINRCTVSDGKVKREQIKP